MSGRARRATRPTPCLFGAALGLAPTAAFRARMWTSRAGRPCPSARWGSPREIPGVGRVCREQAPRYDRGYRHTEGKQRRRARPSIKPAPESKRSQRPKSRSIAVDRAKQFFCNFFSRQFFSIFCLDDFQIQDFCHFDRPTIVKRSRPSRVGAQRSADNFDHPLFNRGDDPPLSARRPTAADGRHDQCAESQPPRSRPDRKFDRGSE